MPASQFSLIVTADSDRGLADLRLLDGAGSQVAFHQVDFRTISISQQQALFDLRTYLRLYRRGQEAASVTEVGVVIAEKILGEEIFLKLWASEAQRTLRIQLPGATEEENPLAAQLARIPWEIARPEADKETLAERNLLVRVVHDMAEPASQPIDLGEDGCLRVLCVFAEARGSTPLSARRERRELERLFESEIYPSRKIVVDFLTHGVTRERLHEQIQGRGGYHVVHWSGHGHVNLLELAKPDGSADRLSGENLLDLFTDAGGFLPQLVFLSACHSGEVLPVHDWHGFLAAARGDEPGTRPAAAVGEAPLDKKIEIETQPGYTGTAHALLQGGVPSVIAMRYAVGDDYARSLAIELYRALFAHPQPKKVAAALTMARNELLREQAASSRFDAADPATPVLYGAEDPSLRWRNGRSPALDTRDRRLHRIPELTVAEHASFVGRTWELAGLGASFIGSAESTNVKPVALVTGLGGMGKTALAAEALDLWEPRFEWVLLYQAKPNALAFDTTLRDVHMKLYAELGRYHEHVQARPADAIYRDADTDFTGPERTERLTRNLLRALRDEAIFLVLDNFESNLKPAPEPGASTEPLWACQDPAWDRCFTLFATELMGAPSRVLITCRRMIAALAGETAGCHRVRLGPLPPGEAALFLRDHEGLSRMVFGPDEEERRLARRLLTASRFHPLLMDRLARLATGGPALRPQLLAALEAIEKNHDATKLPELFAAKPGDAKELPYLEDALAASIDELIQGASPDARRLLWMIAVGNEPVALGLLRGVWSGEDGPQQQQLRQLKQMLDMLPQLPLELQAKLRAIPPELRSLIEGLPPEQTPRPDPAPLLAHLVAVGLVTEERSGPDDENPDLTCHELVRERIRGWMADPERSADRGDLTENAIRLAYAERLEAAFNALQHKNMTTALEAGRRALVYCVQAEAWDRLASFASSVVTSSNDPVFLGSLIPHLQAATESAPEGRPRWRCLTFLADALLEVRPEASLPFYEQAAAQARAVTEAAGDGARQAWSDLGVILGNWANALVDVGDLGAARQREIDSAEANQKAGNPEIQVIGPELEALRIDVMQGRAAEVLPQIESRLARVESWWQRYGAGQPTPEAPDSEFLARVLISALDIAKDAHVAQKDWEPALRRIDSILAVKRTLERRAEDIASTRMNRANVLAPQGRFGEAKAELEACLEAFRNDPAKTAKTLSSLASLFGDQGDLPSAIELQRRALSLYDQLPGPSDRAALHNNLANYLKRSGQPTDRAESPRHQLAALVYRLVAGLGQHLRDSAGNYAIDFRRAQGAGTELAVLRVAELLADPAFRPLEAWLRGRGVDQVELQTKVDEILEAVREKALAAG